MPPRTYIVAPGFALSAACWIVRNGFSIVPGLESSPTVETYRSRLPFPAMPGPARIAIRKPMTIGLLIEFKSRRPTNLGKATPEIRIQAYYRLGRMGRVDTDKSKLGRDGYRAAHPLLTAKDGAPSVVSDMLPPKGGPPAHGTRPSNLDRTPYTLWLSAASPETF